MMILGSLVKAVIDCFQLMGSEEDGAYSAFILVISTCIFETRQQYMAAT
jgi:hypothetical protein